VPGQPERLVALKRREVAELISEELRRMDQDDIYEDTIKVILKDRSAAKQATEAQAPAAAAKTD
jgi:glucose-6-phosphate dehydrogenase assembly protein OpcA